MKPTLKYSEVNITNVCNYSCTHCQSLNNYTFKGHQMWDEYANEYCKLSKKLDIEQLQIIGGEPTLNPDFEKWVEGLSSLWPNTKLQISTNGSRLDKFTSTIYNILKNHKGTLWITCHDIKLYEEFLKFSFNFLDEVISDNEEPPARKVSRKIIDCNGVEIILDWTQTFVSSVIENVDDTLRMNFNSDMHEAHDICGFKNCHQINKGKLYKCPLISVLPDFLDQFTVEMTDADRKLAYSYNPMTAESNIEEFIRDIDKPIPQCKFCPSKYSTFDFVGTDKKIKLISIT